jgi:glycosyltransferase involved in cell wall biosynthesis
VTQLAAPAAAPIAGSRVVIDVRPLQEPERTPITAQYLDALLSAFAAEPLAGESFVPLLRALRPDPTLELEAAGLPVHARRWLPPTSRAFRAAGLTLDSFLLRGAEVGTADDAGQVGIAGAVYHTAGGAVPLASRLPVVATLLDLAAWELPETYAASPAARFGHRLRRRVLHDAARVVVPARAVAESARRRLHLHSERIAVVPLAVDAAFRAAGRDAERQAAVRQRLALPPRYLVFAGRHDARIDLATLFRALRSLRDADQPPLLVLAARYAIEDDLRGLARAAARSGAGEQVVVAPRLDTPDLAALIGGAEGFAYPALSEATGLGALEALSVGVPVICPRAGALPEIVTSAGIVVEPRDPARLTAAIEALWAGGQLAGQLHRQARRRADAVQRSWADVAREMRAIYAAVAAPAAVAALAAVAAPAAVTARSAPRR